MCKCKSKIQNCLCPNSQYVCSIACHTHPPKQKSYNGAEGDGYNFFDILAHNVPDSSPKHKPSKILKRNTTYARDYSPKKIPSPAKLIIGAFPNPDLFKSDKKMSSKTTHKSDFRPFTDADKKKLNVKFTTPKDTLGCPPTFTGTKFNGAAKFTGTSEMKSSYVNPASIKLTMAEKLYNQKVKGKAISPKKQYINVQPLASSTTYTSSYKPPRNFKKTESFFPKIVKLEICDPTKRISQYKADFKRPKKSKRESYKSKEKYLPPDEPMENKTTYRIAYTPKRLDKKKVAKAAPDHNILPLQPRCPCDQNNNNINEIHCEIICKAKTNFDPKAALGKSSKRKVCICKKANNCNCNEKENEIPARAC